MAKVDLTLAARLDLQEIWDYVARDSPFQADRLIERFTIKFSYLAQHTGLGRLRPELADGCKSYSLGKYGFYFRAEDDGILVLRVLHSARDINRIQFPK